MDLQIEKLSLNPVEMGQTQKELVNKCLTQQLEEFELLSSIYCQGEMCIDDISVITDITEYLNGKTETIYRNIGFTLKILLGEKIKCEVSVELSHVNIWKIFLRNLLNEFLNHLISKISALPDDRIATFYHTDQRIQQKAGARLKGGSGRIHRGEFRQK